MAREMIPIDETFEAILISALRYAMGRRTYLVGTMTEYATRHMPYLSDKTLGVMANDIVSQASAARRVGKAFGDSMDADEWRKYRKALADELYARGKARAADELMEAVIR